MSKETRPGFMSTSIIQGFLEDYIKAFTIDSKYVGKQKYLGDYNRLRLYNEVKK